MPEVVVHATEEQSQRILTLADMYSRVTAHAIGRAVLALGLAAAEKDPSLLQAHVPARARYMPAAAQPETKERGLIGPTVMSCVFDR